MADTTRLKIPLVPPSINDIFRLRARVITHLHVLEEHLLAQEAIDIEVGRQVATALLELIDSADRFTPEQRGLVLAAIDYFILSDDEDNDLGSSLGLHDDAELLNEVCSAVQRPDLHIDL